MFEKAWYELSPVVYLAVSIFSWFAENRLATLCGLLLFALTLLVVLMRFQYRFATRALIRKNVSSRSFRRA